MDPSDTFPGSDLTLADLTVTNTGLDNTPTDDTTIANLTMLADMLTNLANDIGPFTIDSAYRSADVNTEVGGVASSAHASGLAADIIPSTMNLAQWFSTLLVSQYPSQLGEMFIKPSQGSIHISLPLPNKTDFPGILDPKTKQYRSFQPDELAYFQNYNSDPTAVPPSSLHLPGIISDVGEVVAGAALPLAAIVAFAAAGFFIYAYFTK